MSQCRVLTASDYVALFVSGLRQISSPAPVSAHYEMVLPPYRLKAVPTTILNLPTIQFAWSRGGATLERKDWEKLNVAMKSCAHSRLNSILPGRKHQNRREIHDALGGTLTAENGSCLFGSNLSESGEKRIAQKSRPCLTLLMKRSIRSDYRDGTKTFRPR
jgi:hypothetical protein